MRRFIPALAALLVLLFATPAQAGLDADLDRVDGRIDQLKSLAGSAREERTDFANQVLDVADELEVLVADLEKARGRLDEVDRQIAATEEAIGVLIGGIAESEARIGEIRTRVDVSRAAALDRAVQLYMAMESSGSSILIVEDVQASTVGIVYADRIEQLARDEIAVFEVMRAQEQREADRLQAQRDDVEAAALRLEDARAQRESEATDVVVQAGRVATRLDEQEALLAEMDAQIAEIEGELVSLAAEQAEIEELIRREQQQGGSAPGLLVRPVPGGVSSGYGYRIHPIYGDRRLHTGWDMNAGCGAPIVAAASGRVFLTDWKGGYGLTVMIDHGGGMSTLYAHQSQVAVVYGQQVSAGQVIGYIGSTGVSTACHLHFEVRIGGAPVDPSPYL